MRQYFHLFKNGDNIITSDKMFNDYDEAFAWLVEYADTFIENGFKYYATYSEHLGSQNVDHLNLWDDYLASNRKAEAKPLGW